MAQVLPIEDVATFIESLAREVKLGIYNARTVQGVIMELPEEITVEAVIVTRAQAFPVTRTTTRANREAQGGGTSEQSETRETTQTEGTSTERGTTNAEQTTAGEESTQNSTHGTSITVQASNGAKTQTQTASGSSSESSTQSTAQSGSEQSSSEVNYEYETKD
jgi:hypothetical protein